MSAARTGDVHIMGTLGEAGLHDRFPELGIRARHGNDHLGAASDGRQAGLVLNVSNEDLRILFQTDNDDKLLKQTSASRRAG